MVARSAGSRLGGCARGTVADPGRMLSGRLVHVTHIRTRPWHSGSCTQVCPQLGTSMSPPHERRRILRHVPRHVPRRLEPTAVEPRPTTAGTGGGCTQARALIVHRLGKTCRTCSWVGRSPHDLRAGKVDRGSSVFGFSSQCGRIRLTAGKACPYGGADVRVESRPEPWGSQRERPCRDSRRTVPIIAPGEHP